MENESHIPLGETLFTVWKLRYQNWHVFNGKYKRRTPPKNMSVREEGFFIKLFECSKEPIVGGGGEGIG